MDSGQRSAVSDQPEQTQVVPVRTYVRVFIALMIMLTLTAGAEFIPLGVGNTIVAYTIAVAKAMLVVLFFMHIKYEGGRTRLFAGTVLVWLLILFTLTLSDYLSRGWSWMSPL